jgi:hypothetical protein
LYTQAITPASGADTSPSGNGADNTSWLEKVLWAPTGEREENGVRREKGREERIARRNGNR